MNPRDVPFLLVAAVAEVAIGLIAPDGLFSGIMLLFGAMVAIPTLLLVIVASNRNRPEPTMKIVLRSLLHSLVFGLVVSMIIPLFHPWTFTPVAYSFSDLLWVLGASHLFLLFTAIYQGGE